MSFARTFALVALAALAALAAAGPALAVCTAGDIYSQEAACSLNASTCVIAKDYTIDNGCTLDFGTKDVTVAATSHLTVGTGAATFKAGHFTLSGLIDGVGSASGANGGMVTIETTGAFDVSSTGQMTFSGNGSGGVVMVHAGSTASVLGKLRSDFLNKNAEGGLISIDAPGNITIGGGSTLSAQGGSDSDGGGEIDLTAGGALVLQSDLDVTGFCGGILELQAGGQVTMQGADASGSGDAGSGGCIDVTAGTGSTILGDVHADGVSGSFQSGGCGGLICVNGGLGDAVIQTNAEITADGASPDGGGGEVTVLARGNALINGTISARGPGGETCGGFVCVETGFNVTLAATGKLDLSGGCDGGALALASGRDMVLNGFTDVSGTQGGSMGGDVTIQAGDFKDDLLTTVTQRMDVPTSGSLTLNNTIDVTSTPSCSVANGCGAGGTTDLEGCDITITQAGMVLASGPDGGENDFTAREQLTVHGTLDARNTVAVGHAAGVNRFIYTNRKAPITQGSSIAPAVVPMSLTTCPQEGDTMPPCLNPCPVCGNGVVEVPETCDAGMIPPQSCSGCSIFCQIEDCDDDLVCTGDSCNPTFGCVNQPTPMCIEPTATPTNTQPTNTVTSTPTVTATGTITGTATATGSPTATATATTTVTATGVPTPSATASATGVATPTGTATQIDTATETPSPQVTPTAPCPGDCNGNGVVAVNELVIGVNIALGNAQVSVCPAFDRNGDQMVTISELVSAVNAALDGC